MHRIDTVTDWFPVNKRTDSWPDGKQSVRFVLVWVYELVKIH